MSDEPQAKAVNRFLELDAFRGIAAMSVLIFHYTYRYDAFFHPDNWINFEWRQGLVGVQFFFMISGFVIYWSLRKSANVEAFAVSRFIRLFPVYWICCTVTFLVLYYFPIQGFDQNLTTYVVNLTMLQSYLKFGHVDGVYWSLTYELGFYFAISMAWHFGVLKHVLVCITVVLFGEALFLAAPRAIPHPLHYILVFHQYGHLFVSGIILYRLKEGESGPIDFTLLALTLPLSYFALGLISTYFYVGFIVAFLLAIRGWLSWLTTPPLLFLGAISYPLYLLHQMLGFRMITELLRLGVSPIIAITLTTISAIGLAAAATYLFERRAMSVLKKAHARRLRRREQASALNNGG